MKILQISNYYAPFVGGIEQVAHDCSEALKEQHEVKVFCFHHIKGDRTDEIDGVEVIRAGSFAKVASQSLSFSYGKLLKKTFRQFQPDAVIFHYPNPFAAHYLLKRLKKYPKCKLIVYWHLDIYKQKILKKFFYGQNKRLCKRANIVLGATPIHLRESAFYRFFSDKCMELPYGIDIAKLEVNNNIEKIIKQIKLTNENKTICFAMGRLVPYKGMEYLIRAAKLLDNSFSIYIAGDGPLRDSLRELAKGCDIVHILGKISNEEAIAYRASCDIFCFPSITRNEGFGLALAEAMYFEKPAVTFAIDKSGVNYVSISGKTGIEVENRNVEDYAKALLVLSRDAEQREKYGIAAKQRVLNNFTFEQFKKNLINLLEKI